MQKFNSNNVEARFIKNLLKNTYLPNIPTVTDGDYIVSGAEYCYKNSIIRCDLTGTLIGSNTIVNNIKYVDRRNSDGEPDEMTKSPSVSDYCVCSYDFKCGLGLRSATYDIVDSIDYNRHIPGLNTNYVSHSTVYDSDTHKQLGKYLRYYRDVKGIDLMPLYNCFCNEATHTVHIEDNKLKNGTTNDYYVWVVPAQLNKKYTLYISSPRAVSIGGVFLNSYGRIKENTINNTYIDEQLDNNIVTYNNLSYNTPITYEMFTTDDTLLSYGNNFYIIIQTTLSEFTSIVAIEGEHQRTHTKVITNSESHYRHIQNGNFSINYSDFSPSVLPSMVRTPLSYYTPYSPRLLEFLVGHAITSEEDISNNISRIRKVLNDNGYTLKEYDVWDDCFRYYTYNNYFKYSDKHYLVASQLDDNCMPKDSIKIPEKLAVYKGDKLVGLKNCKTTLSVDTEYDITGYVDKDVENLLFKYRSV